MKYLKYLTKITIYIIIEFLSLFYTIFIIPYRYKSRSVVYDYYLKTNKFNYLISCISTFKKHKNYNKNILTNKQYKSSVLDTIKFQFYFWVIWIWLDDLATADFLREDKLYKNKLLKNRISKDINIIKNETENCPLRNEEYLKNNKTINISLLTVYANVLANTNNNFVNTFFYTKNQNDIFLLTMFGKKFGWVEKETYELGIIYKLIFFK